MTPAMPTDRDLVAEGRERLALSNLLPLLAQDLGRVVEAQLMNASRPANAAWIVWLLNNAPALLDLAEAAQRPPLGYVVIGKSTIHGMDAYRAPSRKVWPDINRCQLERGKYEIEDETESAYFRRDYVVAEVLEVQP